MNNMFCKCAWCHYSKPRENGGWMCPLARCDFSTSDLERMLKLIGGAK
jgi:hypothetical protein